VNFLAHFHLAGPDGGLIAGGLEGDYFKGPLEHTFLNFYPQLQSYCEAQVKLL